MQQGKKGEKGWSTSLVLGEELPFERGKAVSLDGSAAPIHEIKIKLDIMDAGEDG